jgi:hypothetical protein
MENTTCPICNAILSYIPSRHASKHGLTIDEMKEQYPNLRYSPTQGLKFSEDTRNKMRIKSDKYYESLKLQDRSGSNNAFFGKSHTEDSRSKMGRDTSGDKNPFFGKSHTDESKSTMSSTRSEGISNGTIQTRYHNTGIHLSIKTGKNERYDSKLELYRMIQMDEDLEIKSWTKIHSIRISYNDKNVIRNYVPDFLVEYNNGEIYIEEVKGWDIKAKLKFSVLGNYCKVNNMKFKWHWQSDPIFEGYSKWLKIKNNN